VLAADPLVRDACDLASEAPEERFIDFGYVITLALAAECLGPDFAGPVDVDVGYVRAFELRQEGPQINVEVRGGCLRQNLPT